MSESGTAAGTELAVEVRVAECAGSIAYFGTGYGARLRGADAVYEEGELVVAAGEAGEEVWAAVCVVE